MCRCSPTVRTPFCGAPGCEDPRPRPVSVVRQARVDDTPALVRMACRFIAESSYRGVITPEPTHQARLITWLLEHGGLFVAHAVGVDLDPIGFVAFALTPAILTGELTACEIAWWVEPEHRKGRIGLDLLICGERWAAAAGARHIQMIAPKGADVDVARIYKHRGYLELETLYAKQLAA